jgi:flagellar motor switch protein FliN/FliY
MSRVSSPPTASQPTAFSPAAGPATGAAQSSHVSPDVVARAAEFAALNPANGGAALSSLDHLLNVTVTITAELGRTTRPIGDVLKYGVGSVVELDRTVSEPVELLVQGVPVARGEVVVVDDRFAVRITEIVDAKNRVSA